MENPPSMNYAYTNARKISEIFNASGLNYAETVAALDANTNGGIGAFIAHHNEDNGYYGVIRVDDFIDFSFSDITGHINFTWWLQTNGSADFSSAFNYYPNYYLIYLDGNLVDTVTPGYEEQYDNNYEYQFEGLIPGQSYTAGIVAVYYVGKSAMATIEFIAPSSNPEIAVNPTSLNQTLEPGIIANRILTIENNGDGPLDFGIDIFSVDRNKSDLCTDNLYKYGCMYGDGLTYWNLENINIPDISCSGNPDWYHDYTNMNHNLQPGESYTLTVQSGNTDNDFAVWIDFDDNLILTNDELMLTGQIIEPSTNYTFNITIPSGAANGSHIMRVRTNQLGSVTDPCIRYDYGNCCDFTAMIGGASIPWLTTDIMSGTVLPGESQEVTLTFNAKNLEEGTYENTIQISSNDPVNAVVEVPVTLQVTTQTQPWDYTVTGLVHTISVPNTANPNIYGQPLEPGDWAGVFYIDDNGNEVCGGAAKIDAQGNAVVMAYGDDLTTGAKDGFENGEVFRWKLFDDSTQSSYDATATYDINMPNQGNFANLGLSKLTGIASQWCQDYILAEGWNSLSSYITPTDPAVENIFAPVVDNLTILQNLTSVYWPAEGINTIGNFDNNSGYAVKMEQGTEMSICGPSYASKVLPVSSGWHYLPVLSQCPVETMDFFDSYLDDIVIVQDLIGDQVFWPEMNIYTLETLQPGRAYKIKLNDDITLTFPECDTNQTKQKSVRANTISTPWGTINMTPSTQVTALLTEAMDEIQANDEIGAFGVDGTLFGYMTVPQTNQNQVVVLFGDDTITDTVDGFTEGETVRFKLYRPSTGKEYDLIPTYSQQLSNPTGNYYSSSFAAIQNATLVLVGTEELRSENIRIYPNPAKDVINIQVPGNISSVKILNPLGVVVHSEKIVGSKTLRLNTAALGAGSYILQVMANDGSTINRKIVITK